MVTIYIYNISISVGQQESREKNAGRERHALSGEVSSTSPSGTSRYMYGVVNGLLPFLIYFFQVKRVHDALPFCFCQ